MRKLFKQTDILNRNKRDQNKIKSIISNEIEECFKKIVPALRNSERNFQNGTDVVRFYEKNILTTSIPFIYVTFTTCARLAKPFSCVVEIFSQYNRVIETVSENIDQSYIEFKKYFEVNVDKMVDKEIT